MKHMKKFASLLLALVMVLTMTTTAFAEQKQEGTLTGGTITINNAVEGQTYSAYQILYLESYDANTGAYSYKANSAWKEWLEAQKNYVAIDNSGYVTWVENADVATFAKAALAYAKENSISAVATKEAKSTTVEFSNLKLGYYLVDSTLGTLCSLDTTKPYVTIDEKNAQPTIDKLVEEDSTGEYGKTNDADITQTVNFQSTITAQAGAENYVFHDKMSAGLTYGEVTGITLNNVSVDAKNYTVKASGLTDDCTFEIVFTQEFCDTLKANDKIVISYTATLNENAVVGFPGNPNECKLSYGDAANVKYTEKSKTITYTWDMGVLKYGNGNKSNVLAGAEFKLLNSDKTKAAKIVDGKIAEWVAVDNGTVLTTDKDGKIEIAGLDSDTYYLREIKAPAGYNLLDGYVEVKVSGATTSEEGNQLTYTTVVAEVNNQSGAVLPSTGGMGTTIFYVIGAILMMGSAILLVTRKRMSNN